MLVFRRLCVLGRPPGLCRPGVSSAALCRIRAQSDASDGAPRKIPEVKRITRGAWKAGCDCFCQCFFRSSGLFGTGVGEQLDGG